MNHTIGNAIIVDEASNIFVGHYLLDDFFILFLDFIVEVMNIQ